MSSSDARPIDLALPAALPAETSENVQELVLYLFDACAPRLRRYARSFGLADGVTDDIVQEAFLSLFRHLRLGRPSTNLHGWLFQVVHNLALKQRRNLKRQQSAMQASASFAPSVIDPAANPEERLIDVQHRLRLLAVLQAMPERDRQCLYLRAEGLRYREIGSTLGISLGLVAKLLTRAIARLSTVDKG